MVKLKTNKTSTRKKLLKIAIKTQISEFEITKKKGSWCIYRGWRVK
jgi:hypothetical protein